MAKAIFIERFRFDRRPKLAMAYDIQPSPSPQEYPGDVIAAAIDAGVARPVPREKKRKQQIPAQQKGADL